MSIGERIKAARKAAGYSQAAAASRLEVTQQAVSDWETGRVLPPPPRLVNLAELYGLDPAALLAEAGYRYIPTPNTTNDADLQLPSGLARKLRDASPEDRARLEAYLDGLLDQREA